MTQQLDVRPEPPARRHQPISETYGDPKPLYYQLAAEHTGQFVWQPLEEGPEVWRIRIGRTTP